MQKVTLKACAILDLESPKKERNFVITEGDTTFPPLNTFMYEWFENHPTQIRMGLSLIFCVLINKDN